MVSTKSIQTFVYINSFLMSLAVLVSRFQYFFITSLIRNCAIMLFIHRSTTHKPALSTHAPNRTGFRDFMYLCSSTLVQACTERTLVQRPPFCSFFLVYLFVFELVLDFFHYIMHRASHAWYRFHKTHHHHVHPRVLNTFWHHPIDLFLIESIPTMIAFYCVGGSSMWIQTALVYKVFIEVSGHSGKHVAPSSCFPLCVWIPRSLGIQLYTEDHDKHHALSTCNFSKRFSLWDRVFFTHQ
jgi:hypothetical protein